MTITAALCPMSLQTVLDGAGVPIRGAQVAFFDADTTTTRASFKDAGLTVQHTRPVLTDGYGRVPAIYLGPGAYKLTLSDDRGVLLAVADDLPGATVTTDPGTTPESATTPTGFLMGAYRGDVVEGWVICNGKTIGSAESGASARADDNAKPLFTLLWANDAALAVSGGRGQSASADFNAGKTIALPDFRGRALFGRDGMGVAAAGRITTATTATPDAYGSAFGSEAVTLATAQMPGHGHGVGVTMAAAGGHTHVAATDTQGAHSHTGVTNTVGDHTHLVTYALQAPSASTARTVQPYDAGSGLQVPSSAAGAHNHTVGTDTQGAHVHGVAVTGVGDHTHPLTVAQSDAGGGQAHGNMPPGALVTWYIKL